MSQQYLSEEAGSQWFRDIFYCFLNLISDKALKPRRPQGSPGKVRIFAGLALLAVQFCRFVRATGSFENPQDMFLEIWSRCRYICSGHAWLESDRQKGLELMQRIY